VAEGAGLENRYMHPHIAGSNPALSATIEPGDRKPGSSFVRNSASRRGARAV
jgi:hypothetical protein